MRQLPNAQICDLSDFITKRRGEQTVTRRRASRVKPSLNSASLPATLLSLPRSYTMATSPRQPPAAAAPPPRRPRRVGSVEPGGPGRREKVNGFLLLMNREALGRVAAVRPIKSGPRTLRGGHTTSRMDQTGREESGQ